MQKQGTDVRKKILPHDVFQLQCIVDAFTVSRGWSFHVMQGHVVQPPPRDFRPRRDVDMFLDRKCERDGSGFFRSVEILRAVLEKDGERRGNPQVYNIYTDVHQEVLYDFRDWLAESKYQSGLNEIPPSRFSNTNSNGLWEYSPFLCGAGLMEGLEIMYRLSMILWESVPEPTLLVHLHNMLVQKGYLTKPVELLQNLQNMYKDAFFVGGKIPEDHFYAALHQRVMHQVPGTNRRRVANQSPDLHAVLDLGMNRSFNTKSNLLLYREAGWDLDRIPDSDLQPYSMLGMLRIAHTKQVVDPATGKRRLADTDLVRRLKAKAPRPGMQDEDIIQMTSVLTRLQSLREGDASTAQSMLESIPQLGGYTTFSDTEFRKKSSLGRRAAAPQGHTGPDELLTCVKVDVFNDVCGEAEPRSSANYLFITAVIFLIFFQTEDKLKKLRNPVYVEAYERDTQLRNSKRFGLVAMAMRSENEECLRVMAEVFQESRASFMDHVYWGDLRDTSSMLSSAPEQTGVPDDAGCTVM